MSGTPIQDQKLRSEKSERLNNKVLYLIGVNDVLYGLGKTPDDRR